jgi:hypothetical protein
MTPANQSAGTFGAMERSIRRLGAAEHPELLADGLLALALTVFGQLDLRFNIDGSVHYGPEFAAAARPRSQPGRSRCAAGRRC